MHGRRGYDIETTWVQNKTDWGDIRGKVQSAKDTGFIPIVRLNWGPGYTVPGPNDWTGRFDFAMKCKEAVQRLGDLTKIWIIGNEMNLRGEGGIPADWYLKVFNGHDANNVYDQIRSVQGDAKICLGAVAPNNSDTDASGPYDHTREKWKNYWNYVVNNTGMKIDCYAVHAYGGRQGGQPGDSGFDPDPRDDLNLPYGSTADTVDVAWGFNAFRFFVDEVATKIGDLRLPVYITETNTGQTGAPRNTYRQGWMQGAYEAIDTWNKLHFQKIKTLAWFVYDPAGGWVDYSLATRQGNCAQAADDFSDAAAHNEYPNDADTPDAYVYQVNAGASSMGGTDPNGIVLGSYAGKLQGWRGEDRDWSGGGPAGTQQNWAVIQTRHFEATADGSYGFRTDSADGSWLWVDGRLVVGNSGLHGQRTVLGTMPLTAGFHSVFVKFTTGANRGHASYEWQRPGAGWETIPDGHPKKGNATVYRLNVGATLLGDADPARIVPGQYVGSFGWNGVQKVWGVGRGPLGLTVDWIVQQGGVFWVPSDGIYGFRTGSSDGSWLWVDGQVVVDNHNLGPFSWASGARPLVRGWHMIWFKGYYHSQGVSAQMSYEEQPAGTSQVDPMPIY